MPVYRGNGVGFDVFLDGTEVNIMLGTGQFIIGTGDGGPPFEPGEQLEPGVRATPGTVGYLGDPDDLTVLNAGDPLPEEWAAAWDDGALIVTADNVVIDHYRINADVIFFGDDPTVTNCVIHSPDGHLYGLTINGGGHGVLTVTDTTVVGSNTEPAQSDGISSDSGLRAIRCDVSGTGDGIHVTAQPDPDDCVVSQCVVHDLAFLNEEQHCDAIQQFPHATTDSFFTCEYTYIASSDSTIGTPMNSATGAGVNPGVDAPLVTPVFNDNFLEGGLYHLRLGDRVQNVVVTNNDFGPVHSGEFNYYDYQPGVDIATWSNNRDENGDLIDPPA